MAKNRPCLAVPAFVLLLAGCQSSSQQHVPVKPAPIASQTAPAAVSAVRQPDQGEEELPDDYLPFTLVLQEDRLAGSSQFLQGFEVTMDLPAELLETGLTLESLTAHIKKRGASGSLTYPNGKVTEIAYEMVQHRGTDEIYMKSSLGYFLWERVKLDKQKVSFAIYWWYCPPAQDADLVTLEQAEQLLKDEIHWNRDDDRVCDDDVKNEHWSLFCALKYASIENMGEYNHHNTAMQYVRFAIDELVPNHGYEHTLMDYNNARSTAHRDLLRCLQIAKERIREELGRP